LTALRQRIAEMEALVEERIEGLKKANEQFNNHKLIEMRE